MEPEYADLVDFEYVSDTFDYYFSKEGAAAAVAIITLSGPKSLSDICEEELEN